MTLFESHLAAGECGSPLSEQSSGTLMPPPPTPHHQTVSLQPVVCPDKSVLYLSLSVIHKAAELNPALNLEARLFNGERLSRSQGSAAFKSRLES